MPAETAAHVSQSEETAVMPKEIVGRFKPNLQPKQKLPFKGTKRPKFIKANFFNEHIFFTGPDPYESARVGRSRF